MHAAQQSMYRLIFIQCNPILLPLCKKNFKIKMEECNRSLIALNFFGCQREGGSPMVYDFLSHLSTVYIFFDVSNELCKQKSCLFPRDKH